MTAFVKKLLFSSLSILTALTLTTACGHKEHEEHDHEHEGHEHNASISLTAYTNSFEVYAECEPFVVGEEGHILVHITQLSDFKPITEGNVELTFTSGGKAITEKMDKPSKPGLYIFEVKPAAPGQASLVIKINAKGVNDMVTFTDLTAFTDEHEAHEAAEETMPHHPNSVAFTKEKSWVTDFATAVVTTENIGGSIRAMALVEPTPLGERTLCATTPGRVSFLNAHLALGEKIGAGQSLFKVDATGIAEGDMKLRIMEAQAEYDRAKRELDRMKELSKDKLTTAAELSKAQADFDTASARLSMLKKYFSGGGQTISAPISGYISKIEVTNGQWVEAGQPLATIASSSMLQLSAKVPSRYASDLNNISNIKLLSAVDHAPTDISALGGRIISRGAGVEAGSPMVPVVFEIDNKLGLIPGTYVESLIQFSGGERMLAVPRSAIVEEMGSTFVFVQITPELFEKRAVTLGNSDGVYAQILSGLNENERIVSRGAPIVKLSQSAGALDPHAGHAH